MLSTQMLIVFVLMLLACNKHSSSLASNPRISCIESEKQALLKFKDSVVDDDGVLSSWGSEPDKKDCCKWWGVKCNHHTGHVTVLNLSRNNFPLAGKISSSLLELQHLKYLDLSWNNFVGNYSPIPNHHLGNVSSLRYLSLRENLFLSGGNLEWLSYFPLLRHLDLRMVDLSQATNWLELVSSNNLPLLEHLDLSDCQLPNPVPLAIPLNSSLSLVTFVDLSANSLSSASITNSFANLSSLQSLDMSANNLTEQLGEILDKLSGSEKSLQILNLGWNQLSGTIANFTRFSSLRELSLNNNQLTGPFPTSFQQVLPNLGVLNLHGNRISGMLPDLTRSQSLTFIDLGDNSLNGTIDKSVGQLSRLEHLDISGNSLEGIISEAHFSNLSSLKYLDFSFNSLVFNISSNWIPSFQLDVIRLASCKLGTDFPKWLRNQNNYSELDISGAGISDVVSNWFWDQLPSNLTTLNLSKNLFSGSISLICAITGFQLSYLDLSSNQLSGGLPDCWEPFQELKVMNLASNNLSGKLPSSIGSLFQLQALQLRDNNFTGELPESLKNCTELRIIDLGGNRFTGKIQPWIGTHLMNLMVLSLRFNKFYGGVPRHICLLDNIQVLDFSQNDLSGKLPRCFDNFSVLVESDYGLKKREILRSLGNIMVQWKGQEREYAEELSLRELIDLSSNKFSGKIPREIASLAVLRSLNLSRILFCIHLTYIACKVWDMSYLGTWKFFNTWDSAYNTTQF